MWYIKLLLSTGSTHIFLAVCACLIHHFQHTPSPPSFSTNTVVAYVMSCDEFFHGLNWPQTIYKNTNEWDNANCCKRDNNNNTDKHNNNNNDDHLWQADAANSVQRKRKLQPNALRHSAYAPLAPAPSSCALCAPRGEQLHVVVALDNPSSRHSTAQTGRTVVRCRIEANCCHELSSLC